MAILCNHQKAVSKNHKEQIEKAIEDIASRKEKLIMMEKLKGFLKKGKEPTGALKAFAAEKGMPKTVDSC